MSFCLVRTASARLRRLPLLAVTLVLFLVGVSPLAAQIARVPVILTVAGTGGGDYSGDGGAATSAQINTPNGVALDSAGNLYIADTFNNRIRRVDAVTGMITTVAGTGVAGFSGDGGAATSAQLFGSTNVALDSAGNLYIADYRNDSIRRVDRVTGNITTVAGNQSTGFSGDGGLAINAQLNGPNCMALDSVGNLYIADSDNNRIRRVDAVSGNITTVAGNGSYGFSGDNGLATSAEIYFPFGVALDSAGNLYIADTYNNSIRRVDAVTRNITTVAGTSGTNGFSGDNGLATSAQLSTPFVVALDSAGSLYIADPDNNRVRRVDGATGGTLFSNTAVQGTSTRNVVVNLTAAQKVSSIAALNSQGGQPEYTVGPVTGCVVDGTTLNPAGTLCTIPVTFKPAYAGRRNVPLQMTTNTGTWPLGLRGFGTGPQHALTPGIITTVAGNGGFGFSGDGGAAASAQLYTPNGVTFDSAGNLYIADTNNNRIRRVDAVSGMITTVAGTGVGDYSGDGGAATSAQLYQPYGVALDSSGNLYIVDTFNNRIRRVDAVSGMISTVAGTGNPGSIGDGGRATSAQLASPISVALDSAGNLYIADSNNNRIRRVDAVSGMISTVAGTGSGGSSGDGGSAASAQLNTPSGVTLDSAGNLYITDTANYRIRRVDTAGMITTVAGTGSFGFSGDGGSATSAQLYNPSGVALDSAGSLYIADTSNSRVRRVDVSTTAALSFAVTDVNATSSDSPQTVTLSNIGNADLSFPIPPSGSNPSIAANFTLNSGSAGTCPLTGSASFNPGTLASGASCTLPVSFTPQMVGSISGSLTLTDNNLNIANSTQTILLSGIGVAAPDAPTIGTATADNTQATVTFTAPSSDGGAAITGYTVTSLPGGLSGTCSTSPCVVTGLTNGTAYTFTVTATNSAGTSVPSAPSNSVTSMGSQTIAFVNPGALIYGTTPTLTATASSGLTVTFTSTTPAVCTISGGTVTFVTAGTCTIDAEQNGNSEYLAATTVSQSFTVNKGTLILTTNNATRLYGTANPTLTGTVNGAGNGDTFTSSYSTTATQTSNVGAYAIVPSVSGASLGNYTVNATNGSLTITQAAATTSLSASSASIPSGQSVTLTAQVQSSTTGMPTGTVSFYDGAVLLGTSALNSGVSSFTVSNLATGAHTLSASYAGDVNFTGSSSSSTVPVAVATLDFTFTLTGPGSQTVMPGHATSYLFAIAPLTGTYPGAVSFTATGLPPGATASFSPATIAANGGLQTVTVTIQTASTTGKMSNPFQRDAPLGICVLLLPLAGLKWKRRGVLMSILLLAGLVSLNGCGAGNGFMGRSSKNYSITATATAGSVQHNSTVNLNVQ